MKRILFSKLFFSLFYLSYAQSVSAQNQMDPYQSIESSYSSNSEVYGLMPSSQAPFCSEGGWMFKADFLYWSTDFNSISSIDAIIQPDDTAFDATIQIKHPSQTWDPGVRLTAGWVDSNNWDIQASWTNFYNSTTNHTAPFMLQVATENLNTEGSSKFAFRYNAADLQLGKTMTLSDYIIIRPFIGVQAIWTQISSNLNLTVPPLDGSDGFTAGLRMKKDAWGIGPKIGINSAWGNLNGFSLIANINGSLAYGKQKSKTNLDVDVGSTVDINIHLMGSSHWQLMSTVQFQSGLAYNGQFLNNDFRINALWECNTISHASDILIFDKSINTQGLTLSLEYLY